ncbi:hypothetical protein EDD68_10238 [Melghiribacillus thermohalophilus]|uniref:Uncharacterized protein n=1 Tax=Melghiribacillus thermohalophilus TaxID=1324956 RepID=A0A4R3NGL5_9BACI|nr:hypothetical protein [Melghiribacillus thermohalophilus]TCT26337.1 hypothetical protein EDD68_10238 [Melghiribacillus thermohalophilus]
MKNSFEKYYRMQYAMMAISLIFGILSLWRDVYHFLLLLAFYALALSFIFEGIGYYVRNQPAILFNHLIRAMLIVVFATYIFITF